MEPTLVLRHKLEPRLGGLWETLEIYIFSLPFISILFVYRLHVILSLQTNTCSILPLGGKLDPIWQQTSCIMALERHEHILGPT